ncbi:MAG: metal ABC transporter ATP-binding protein [Desulfitobacteriaceae bacterium]
MSHPFAIEFDNFDLNFGQNRVLKNINLAIHPGSCIGIIGPNGSGKTSLLRSIVGLNRPSSGKVRVLGQSPGRSWRRRQQIGYVPQLKSMDREFPISVYEVVMLGRVGRLGLGHSPKKEDHLLVEKLLRRVNILDLAHRPIGQLSGGQTQRVFIARALAQESQVLLFDEPGTGLDIPTQQSIYVLLEELHEDGVTTVTTTHDLMALEFHHFEKILCLNKRIVAFGPPEEVLTTDILTKTFSGVPWPSQLANLRA